MIYLPHRVSGGIVESACATCGSTRLVRSCAFDRMIDEEIKNRSNDPQLPDIGIRSGIACCGAGQSVRTVRISSRYSVGAGISAGVSIAREASRRTCALAAPHAIPAPDHPISPADRSPKRYRRHRHSSGRHSPNRSLVPRGRNLRTAPTPYSAPETNTTRKHRGSTVPQPPDATGTHSPPPKRTLPENTDAAPSRNLRTPPAPIRLPKRTPPENTEAAPIRSPLQKNAIIPAGTSSGRDDPHSERRRTASRDDGMSAVGPPSGKTALLPRQPSAPLRIPPSQAGRPLRLQKRSH